MANRFFSDIFEGKSEPPALREEDVRQESPPEQPQPEQAQAPQAQPAQTSTPSVLPQAFSRWQQSMSDEVVALRQELEEEKARYQLLHTQHEEVIARLNAKADKEDISGQIQNIRSKSAEQIEQLSETLVEMDRNFEGLKGQMEGYHTQLVQLHDEMEKRVGGDEQQFQERLQEVEAELKQSLDALKESIKEGLKDHQDVTYKDMENQVLIEVGNTMHQWQGQIEEELGRAREEWSAMEVKTDSVDHKFEQLRLELKGTIMALNRQVDRFNSYGRQAMQTFADFEDNMEAIRKMASVNPPPPPS